MEKMVPQGSTYSKRNHLIPILVLVVQLASAQTGIPVPDPDGIAAWPSKAVWYQIFPERFRNGDPSNDPMPADLKGSWPHFVPPGWKISPWTDDWYKLQPWEKEDSRGFYLTVQNRRFGGDLQGVIDKLDYLRQLGINALYFTPLFESPSLHKYDAACYHHIDDNFGPNPGEDKRLVGGEDPSDPNTWVWTTADRLFLELIEKAHEKGMRVIIDGVFNHVGLRFWAFQDVLKNQDRSPYRGWFIIKKWDDPATAQNEFDYQGWANVRELPEVQRTSEGLSAPFEQHVKAVVKRWMDPNGDGDPSDGIDGWRLDVAEKVPIPFWKRFRGWVKEVNPNAYLVGEVWWEDWRQNKMFNAAPWLQGDVFDAVMNYRWAREAFRFFAASKEHITASEFSRRLTALLEDYPSGTNDVLMNLYDSHDTDRMGSRLMNADLPYDHEAGLSDNHSYDVRKPGPRELMTQKLMVIFQMTSVGAPMIYYGSEAGMWGADDPDCRKPMLWPDYRYDDEQHHPFNADRKADPNKYDQELFRWYSQLITLRNGHPVLCTGTFEAIVMPDKSDIFAFRRGGAGEEYIVVLNNAWTVQQVTIPVSHNREGELTDLLSQRKYPVKDAAVTMTLDAKSGVVLQ